MHYVHVSTTAVVSDHETEVFCGKCYPCERFLKITMQHP